MLLLLRALMFFSTLAHAENFGIWSDAHGILSAPFCENTQSVPDPRLNAFRVGSFRLPDESVWRSTETFVKCAGTTGVYEVFERALHGVVDQVGVNPAETQIFAQAEAQTVHTAAALDLPAGVSVSEGPLEYVVCISGNSLNVRDESLAKVLFTANRFDVIKPVQSFGTDKIKKTIGGVEYSFIKAEFPAAQVGWVAEQYVRTRSECPGAAQKEEPAPIAAPTAGWTFPTIKRPTDSYKEGMRRFRASRSGGRLHAACDLYRVTGEDAVAISPGTVIRDRYYFYQGTYALEIKHTGGRVARYGEVTGKAAAGVSSGKAVKIGQTVAYIGKVNSNCCKPMLHFEMYSGTASGSLTQGSTGFQRRKDLIDGTSLLSEWEKAKFGVSY